MSRTYLIQDPQKLALDFSGQISFTRCNWAQLLDQLLDPIKKAPYALLTPSSIRRLISSTSGVESRLQTSDTDAVRPPHPLPRAPPAHLLGTPSHPVETLMTVDKPSSSPTVTACGRN